jgi:hypothetical protein
MFKFRICIFFIFLSVLNYLYKSFVEFCNLSVGHSEKGVRITSDDVFNGLNKINIQVTPIQATELFRILDNNKDGYIDK